MLSDGRTGSQFKFEQMIKEETEILYSFKGAYTLQDLQEMTEYELMLITEAHKDIKDVERLIMEWAKQNPKWNGDIPIPKLKNSRFNLPEEDKKSTN